ncbi:MAG: regulatory protein TetR [Acidimicrobiales bacterium]|nr:regulatory protein TetR [Acidimicrobiales bacterium]
MTTTARARVRAELTEEIKAIARRHVAEQGASSLSLRAVTRELGMVSSAVYRYFASRDELLTALIVDAYNTVAAAAEAADATKRRSDTRGRWIATAHAVRDWAKANPEEYALIYGSPVPGYQAPADTIDPALRVSLVPLRIIVDGVANGAITTDERIETTRTVRDDLAQLRSLAAPGVPDSVLSRGLLVWTQVMGAISYELFGHLHNVVHDDDAFFDLQVRQAGRYLLRGAANPSRPARAARGGAATPVMAVPSTRGRGARAAP